MPVGSAIHVIIPRTRDRRSVSDTSTASSYSEESFTWSPRIRRPNTKYSSITKYRSSNSINARNSSIWERVARPTWISRTLYGGNSNPNLNPNRHAPQTRHQKDNTEISSVSSGSRLWSLPEHDDDAGPSSLGRSMGLANVDEESVGADSDDMDSENMVGVDQVVCVGLGAERVVDDARGGPSPPPLARAKTPSKIRSKIPAMAMTDLDSRATSPTPFASAFGASVPSVLLPAKPVVVSSYSKHITSSASGGFKPGHTRQSSSQSSRTLVPAAGPSSANPDTDTDTLRPDPDTESVSSKKYQHSVKFSDDGPAIVYYDDGMCQSPILEQDESSSSGDDTEVVEERHPGRLSFWGRLGSWMRGLKGTSKGVDEETKSKGARVNGAGNASKGRKAAERDSGVVISGPYRLWSASMSMEHEEMRRSTGSLGSNRKKRKRKPAGGIFSRFVCS